MRVGDAVAVRDTRACRWCRAEIVSLDRSRTRATVVAAEWWGVLPIKRALIRPIAVVRA